MKEKFKNAKIITSCGSTGIFIDGVLNEDFDVTKLDKIKSMIDNTFEVEYTHEDGSVKDVPEFGDGFDEWTITILV